MWLVTHDYFYKQKVPEKIYLYLKSAQKLRKVKKNTGFYSIGAIIRTRQKSLVHATLTKLSDFLCWTQTIKLFTRQNIFPEYLQN